VKGRLEGDEGGLLGRGVEGGGIGYAGEDMLDSSPARRWREVRPWIGVLLRLILFFFVLGLRAHQPIS